jgi:hypothetical protein
VSTRLLSEQEITECTGARLGGSVTAGTTHDAPANKHKAAYEVQLDGSWIEVDYETYERVREIQDSCA